jgi:beta-mannosidase
MPTVIEKYLGAPRDLEDLVRKSQLLQSAGYQAIFEEVRRQKPRASVAMNWCLNEPWPCAANNSLVAWPADPEPALVAVGASLRPVLASARVPRFDWMAGAPFSAELFLLNDSPRATGPVEIIAELLAGSERTRLGTWACSGSPAGTNCTGPVLQGVVPPRAGETFELAVDVVGRSDLSSRYTLAFSRADSS